MLKQKQEERKKKKRQNTAEGEGRPAISEVSGPPPCNSGNERQFPVLKGTVGVKGELEMDEVVDFDEERERCAGLGTGKGRLKNPPLDCYREVRQDLERKKRRLWEKGKYEGGRRASRLEEDRKGCENTSI